MGQTTISREPATGTESGAEARPDKIAAPFFRQALISLACLALAAAIGGYFYFDRYGRYFEDTNDATIQADQVAIASKLSGYVRTVAVDDNQAVTAGMLLMEIDPVDYQTRLAAAEAAIASALAAGQAAGAARAEAVAGIGAARANLQAAQANLDHVERELVRHRPLVKKGIEPDALLTKLITDRDHAAAEVTARHAAVVQAERRVESITAQITQLGAEVDSARVQRQAAANDLSSTRLTAPITGRVASRSARIGQFVQPGMRLMTIVPEQDIYVVANFKETQVGLMRPGQPATIRVDALPGIEFSGQVSSVTPGTGANFSLIPPQNATGNFTKIVQRVPVRIRIEAGPQARRILVPGLSLVVEVDTRAARHEIDTIRAEQQPAG